MEPPDFRIAAAASGLWCAAAEVGGRNRLLRRRLVIWLKGSKSRRANCLEVLELVTPVIKDPALVERLRPAIRIACDVEPQIAVEYRRQGFGAEKSSPGPVASPGLRRGRKRRVGRKVGPCWHATSTSPTFDPLACGYDLYENRAVAV